MDKNSERLRITVITRRGQLRLNQEQAAKRGGVPYGTWESIEQGRSQRPHAPTLAGVDTALEWPIGTARKLLYDTEPPPDSVLYSDT